MAQKVIYVPDRDKTMWDEFEHAARARGKSASALLAEIMRYWLNSISPGQDSQATL